MILRFIIVGGEALKAGIGCAGNELVERSGTIDFLQAQNIRMNAIELRLH